MGFDHIVFHAICIVKHFSPSFPPPYIHNDNVHKVQHAHECHTEVTSFSPFAAANICISGGFGAAASCCWNNLQCCVREGFMLIPWICFLQHFQEFLCCYSWIVLLQSVSRWKDKRCLLPWAERHLPGPLSSVVLLYCGLSTSTTCLQAVVNSSKIIKQTCGGTRCLFFPAQVFADFPWCPKRRRL